jgi:aryl-alcohol dehydrogenase-like predicted oxidoreductase
MGKALQAYNIPRQKIIIMTKCYRVTCDSDNYDVASKPAMHEDLADQSKDYVNQWGKLIIRISLLRC